MILQIRDRTLIVDINHVNSWHNFEFKQWYFFLTKGHIYANEQFVN